MGVVVTALEAGLVDMLVGMCLIAVSVFVRNVLVLVAVMGVRMGLSRMGMLMIVGRIMLMFFIH